jgi:dCTP deaminase
MNDAAAQALLPIVEEKADIQSGIWPAQRLKAGVERGDIRAVDRIEDAQIQPASLDLRLGSWAYRVPASFLPGPQTTVRDKLEFLADEKLNIEQGAVLQRGQVYIVELQESLRLKRRTSGSANPKSSTGRLDVFARVITDFGIEFDVIPERYNGPLWLEIAPRSFNVMVRRGSRLAQARIRHGSPPSSDAFVRRLNDSVRLVRDGEGPSDVKDGAIALSVDVQGDPVSGVVGYKAKRTDEFIDVDKVNHYDPEVFWQRVYRPEKGGIILEINDFHILATKETVAVPNNLAADMVAYDTMVGEFRVHYAGFFDPGFGYAKSGAEGTTIVLEVRSHEVPFMIEHGQIVGRVVVERLTEPTDKPYGSGIGSSYQSQGLTLSKHFRR